MKRSLFFLRNLAGTALLVSGILLMAGCDSSATTEAPTPAGTATESAGSAEAGSTTAPANESQEGQTGNPMPSSTATPPAEKAASQASTPRSTTEGWWQILFSMPSLEDGLVHDFSAGYVRIAKDGDAYVIGELRKNDIFGPAELAEESGATADSVTMRFSHQDIQFDFLGKLVDGVVRGNIQFNQPRQNLVRLEPVEESEITDESLGTIGLGPTSGAQEMHEITTEEDPLAALRSVDPKQHVSPAYYYAWEDLLRRLSQLKLESAGIDSLVQDFVKAASPWGERVVHLTRIKAAVALLGTGQEVESAKKLLAETQEAAPEIAELWKDDIAAAERHAALGTAWEQVKSGDAQAGLATLRELQAAAPTDELTTYRLASAERSAGSKENAERLFATLAVQPKMYSELQAIASEEDFQEPREAVAGLYKERTGGDEGLESYLAGIYRETVTAFVPDEEVNRPASESSRVVLLELFTGATCPPCVAADIGTEAIEKSFPREDVVVLRYHLHIPGPDPLATADTEARQEYYASDIQGTPTVLVNGTTPPMPVGGFYDRAPVVYQGLAGFLSEKVKEPTTATLDASATVEDGKLRLAVNGSSGEKPFDTVKLRIVIAENEIHFAAPNGIQEHSMIVRSMPGGADGSASEMGKYTFEEVIDLAEVQKQVNDYLDAFERRGGSPFDIRPSSLRKLTVVAFLQDDVTHEVLQTAIVPIEQDIVPNGGEKPAAENKEDKPAETAEKAEEAEKPAEEAEPASASE